MRLRRPHPLHLAGLLLFFAASCDRDPTGAPPPRSLEISTPSAFLDVGQSLSLSASAKDAAGLPADRARVTWSSSNPAVLEVADGTVTGRAAGTAYVRASAGEASDSVLLTIEVPVARLIVWPADTIRIIRGREATLFVEMSDSAGNPVSHSLEITSSAPGIAPVRDRVLSGQELGSARVTVLAGIRSIEFPVEVVTGSGYTVRSLGPFSPNGLNNLGWIAGYAEGQAALWRNGVVTKLLHDGFASSVAIAVNDSGAVMGTATPADGSPPVLWTWRAGVMRPIPLDGFPGGEGRVESIEARGLNNRGEVVGFVRVQRETATTAYGFHWNGSRTEWLPDQYPSDINDQGTITAGRVVIENGVARPVPPPTGWVSGMVLAAARINNKGQYVGTYNRGCYGGFFWDGSTMWTSESIGGIYACSPLSQINNYADLIGHCAGTGCTGMPAQLIRGGKETRLYIPGWENAGNSATGLNDLGQVAIILASGPRTGFLLSPAS